MTSSFEGFVLSCRCLSFLCGDDTANHGEAISDVTQFHARLPNCLGKDSPPARLCAMLRTAYWQTIVDQHLDDAILAMKRETIEAVRGGARVGVGGQ